MESLGAYNEAILLNVENVGKSFMNTAHTHSCCRVVKKCMETGCNKTFLTKGG